MPEECRRDGKAPALHAGGAKEEMDEVEKEAAQHSTSRRLDRGTLERFKIFFMRFARLRELRRALVPIKKTEHRPRRSGESQESYPKENPAAPFGRCGRFFFFRGKLRDERLVVVAQPSLRDGEDERGFSLGSLR